LHWTLDRPPGASFAAKARCRHRQPLQDCQVTLEADDRMLVAFAEPQRALTPGQSVVLYQGRECLGGGIIN
jgi:tRNA-specific 2-thiouridylase